MNQETTTEIAEKADDPGSGANATDERLSHRGPFQRLLTSPEIGALIGAVAIWAFFWAVSVPFGTAGGTANWLDVAATLGIMAVVVSMLMIGGEFDLSSGAMTGATGILVIMLVKDIGELGGAGLNLWIALPLSFLAALGVGWFNGTMVERTSLPSFIVTLGTFFVVRGAKLGFSKLIVDNVQVGRIDEGAGYEFWVKVFASTWTRTEHQFDNRDVFYNQFLLAGLVFIALAFFEMNFRRSRTGFSVWTGVALVGAVIGLGAYAGMHSTDGTSINWILAIVAAAGALIGIVGWARWRYDAAEPAAEADAGSMAVAGRYTLIGLALVGAAVLFAWWLDSTSERTVAFLITIQGLRAMLFVSLFVIGLVYLSRAAGAAGRAPNRNVFGIQMLIVAVIVAVAFFIQIESASRKFRTEFFSVMLLIALLFAVWSVVSLISAERRTPDPAADAWGRRLVLVGVLLAIAGVVIRLLFTTTAEIEAGGVPPASFSVRILWFLLVTIIAVFTLGRTRFGSWAFAVGGNKEAARQVGVPAARTKTQLFMIVSAGAWLVGMLLAFRLNSLQASTGDGLEFEYIIAAVVGGNLLTGGYGSAAGGAIGALIMAMSAQGIPFAGWNSDWRFVFLGVILLLAVIANNLIRARAEASRR